MIRFQRARRKVGRGLGADVPPGPLARLSLSRTAGRVLPAAAGGGV